MLVSPTLQTKIAVNVRLKKEESMHWRGRSTPGRYESLSSREVERGVRVSEPNIASIGRSLMELHTIVGQKVRTNVVTSPGCLLGGGWNATTGQLCGQRNEQTPLRATPWTLAS